MSRSYFGALALVALATPAFAEHEHEMTPAPAATTSADAAPEADDPGRGRLDWSNSTFIDFQDVSLDELLGEGQRLRFSANLFGNVGVSADAPPGPPVAGAFYRGPLGLLVTADLGAHVTTLGEIAFTTTAALHRVWVRWRNERLYVIAGRDHANVGYWNAAYHHGSWLQLTVDRPRFLSLSSPQVFVVHTEGVEAGTAIDQGGGKIHLALGINNGRELTGFAANRVQDKALLATAYYERRTPARLRVGASAFYDRLAPADAARRPALPDQAIDEVLVNVHAVHISEKVHLIAEAYGLFHLAGAQAWRTLDAFAAAGYRLGDFTPYARGEVIEFTGEGDDPVFLPGGRVPETPLVPNLQSVVEATLGLRYDTSNWSALKLEYRLTQPLAGGAPAHAAFVDWSFGL